METKKYVPRASTVNVGNNVVETLPVDNNKFICIEGKYKKTKEPLTIMMKVDDDLYYVKFKRSNVRCLMKKGSIIDADLSKIS